MASIIKKYFTPTRYSYAPFGTIYKVLKDDDNYEIYIQVSPNENLPRWEKFGIILEKALEEFIDNEEFIKDCLRLYELKEISSFLSITKVISDN